MVTDVCGPSAFSKFEEEVVGDYCVVGLEDPNGVDAVQIEVLGRLGMARVYGPEEPPITLKHHEKGVWCFMLSIFSSDPAGSIERSRVRYERAINALKKPGATLADAIKAFEG